MIYIKRIANADITRQIDLTKETSSSFFAFDPAVLSERSLAFLDESTNANYSGCIKKSGHSVTITGDIFSFVKQNCNFGDIIVFSTTKNNSQFKFHVIKRTANEFTGYDHALNLFGSRSGSINETTHLIASIDEGDLAKIHKDIESVFAPYQTALRTKPFLLLAGISGTGKSQKVQELAYMTCPINLRSEDSTTPGNYCLIEVKPNWHDSTELLGYYSALSGKYELTSFVRFCYKAIQNPETPFFVCLDEMNLAPVEQYFAEYLSVLETRKRYIEKDEVVIKTAPLLDRKIFANCELVKQVSKAKPNSYMLDQNVYTREETLYSTDDAAIITYLKANGLHIPDNLFVIGTVNMDDTTHQFSRKVIDRAFTIEMNGGKMEDMFKSESKYALEYRSEPVKLDVFKSSFVKAYEVLDDEHYLPYREIISTIIPKLLGNSDGTAEDGSMNGVLNNTPFRVSYRVQNELVLYLSVLIERAGFPEKIDTLISEAFLAILLEKVLPRIQGEAKQLETKDGNSNILKDLIKFVETNFKPDATQSESDQNDNLSLYTQVIRKLKEMDDKLSGYYTNFF